MRKSYTIIIALATFVLGYFACYLNPALISGAKAPTTAAVAVVDSTSSTADKKLNKALPNAPLPLASTVVSSNELFRVTKSTKTGGTADFYIYGVTYKDDGVTLNTISVADMIFGTNIIQAPAGTYTWTSETKDGSITTSAAPTPTTYTLTASTITCSNGVITGKQGSDIKSFSLADVVTVTGGTSVVTFGVVSLETLN